MQIYLVIITTTLVLTQLIRVAQNAKQIKSITRTDRENNLVMAMWEEIAMDVRSIKNNLDYKK